MSTYHPDRWVLVELSTPTETVKKVFAGWYGGYLGSDSWKLSSEVVTVTEKDDSYEFLNQSGSTYVCHVNAYGMTGYMMSIFANWETQQSDKVSIRIVDETEIGTLSKEPIPRANEGI